MNNLEKSTDPVKSYILLPTLTSSINIMDFLYHPKIAIGVMTGDKDFKGITNYNLENRTRVLLDIEEIIKKDLSPVSFEEVAVHFSDQTIKTKEVHNDIINLNNVFTNHRNRQKDKHKLKMSPMPTPNQKPDIEEEKKKNLLKNNPFVINAPKPL